MELLIQITALVLALLLAFVKSLQYTANGVSGFELKRRAQAGDPAAIAEERRRRAIPTLTGLKYLKEIIISVAIAALLIGTQGSLLGTLMSVVYFFAAYVIGVRGWLSGPARSFQRAMDAKLIHWGIKLQPALRFMTSAPQEEEGSLLASREELAYLVASDKHALKPEDKDHVLGALKFGELTIADAMVPRDHIATVDVKETVGPVLLDKLHKAGHNVFVAVKKDFDDVQGWLYMSDATSGHPDLKLVKDAVRPTVHYVLQSDPLEAVLSASLQSGRQMFIVVDNNGNITGLITLGDALTKLLGSAPPSHIHLSTDPTKVSN